MIENTTNLTNATNLVNSIDIIPIVTGIIIAIVAGIGLVFEWIQYRKYKRAAKEQIIKHLEQFILLEETKKGIVKLDDYYQIKIEGIGNDLKDTLKNIDKKLILFPQDFLKNARAIVDKILTLSKRRNIDTKGYDALMAPVVEDRIKMRENAGNELVEKAKELIVKLEK